MTELVVREESLRICPTLLPNRGRVQAVVFLALAMTPGRLEDHTLFLFNLSKIYCLSTDFSSF